MILSFFLKKTWLVIWQYHCVYFEFIEKNEAISISKQVMLNMTKITEFSFVKIVPTSNKSISNIYILDQPNLE